MNPYPFIKTLYYCVKDFAAWGGRDNIRKIIGALSGMKKYNLLHSSPYTLAIIKARPPFRATLLKTILKIGAGHVNNQFAPIFKDVRHDKKLAAFDKVIDQSCDCEIAAFDHDARLVFCAPLCGHGKVCFDFEGIAPYIRKPTFIDQIEPKLSQEFVRGKSIAFFHVVARMQCQDLHFGVVNGVKAAQLNIHTPMVDKFKNRQPLGLPSAAVKEVVFYFTNDMMKVRMSSVWNYVLHPMRFAKFLFFVPLKHVSSTAKKASNVSR